jgi:hypothetical protein
MVVSAYAKQNYVSGPSSNPTCPNSYCHDFGSILNFIEHTFGLGTINGSTYKYADSTAMDAICSGCSYSLADFFNYNQQQRSFTYIQGANYPTACYTDPIDGNSDKSTCFPDWPSDPDNDGVD